MFAMIAATRPKLSLCETLAANAGMLRELRATPYPFRRAIGVWKSDMEVSFQVIKPVTLPVADFLDDMEKLALEQYKQEAILIVHDDGQTYLRDDEGIETHLGHWQEVEDTSDLDGYTILNGQAYAAL